MGPIVTWKISNEDSGVSIGCPNGICRGYELAADIDFLKHKMG